METSRRRTGPQAAAPEIFILGTRQPYWQSAIVAGAVGFPTVRPNG